MRGRKPQPKTNPKAMFESAFAYRAAANKLQPIDAPGQPSLEIPYVVLAAISLEILLKCVLSIEQEKWGSIHNLLGLFQKISIQRRDRIRYHFSQSAPECQSALTGFYTHEKLPGPVPVATLETIITLSARAFEDLRYHYEGNLQTGTGWWADPVFGAVVKTIVETHSEWVNS